MDKYWIYVALLSISFSVQALQIDGDHFPDYWQDDTNYDWYNDELEKLGILSSEDNVEESKTRNDVEVDAENDRKVAQDIQNFRSDIEDQFGVDSADVDLEDYQIEDNRSKSEDEGDVANGNKDKESVESLDDSLDALGELAADVADLNRIKESLDDSKKDKKEAKPLTPIKKFDADTNDILDPGLNKNKTDEILQETKDILKEDEGKNDFLEVIPLNNDVSNLNATLEETRQILNSTDDKLEEEEVHKVNKEELDDILKVDEDNLKNFQEAYDDMLAWSKMSESLNDTNSFNDTVSDDEEELNEIYKEYLDLPDDYEKIYDGNLILLGHNKKQNEEAFPDDTRSEEESKHKEQHPIQYLNDALIARDGGKNPDAELIPEKVGEVTKSETNVNEEVNSTTETDYNYVVRSEHDEVIEKFKQKHEEDFNFKSENFDKHIAPIHITLSEVPVVVTSPNYPANYPTNNIIDWIFYGDGEGIEFNVTDFGVNGHNGDYLLVKPGGVDSSANDGLIFSYTLATKRQYLFLDVNRMFVRFEAKPGMQFMRGFSFSVKILRHSTFDFEPEPSPEPIRPLPHSTITLNLGGTNLEDFNERVEEFRGILADMATMYINANNINHGLNTTLEATQVVSIAQCFHNWPKFEQCIELKFGVSLEYEGEQEPRLNEEDLTDMWQSYFDQDPFAARLRRMGITEYQVPNDKGVLVVWLVIGCGVAISVAMLAFALWRFSCFEDYSRMPRFSDADSVQDKRGLDLYPTPHQTLPPLYAESEYKWSDNNYLDSTRVDLGGYANKNYLADDTYGLDSDDEVTDARNSNRHITPKDIYV